MVQLEPSAVLMRVKKTVGKVEYSGKPIETTAQFADALEIVMGIDTKASL